MTAIYIAEEMGIKHVKINFNITEFMKQRLFKNGNPHPSLEVIKLPTEMLFEKYGLPKGIKVEIGDA